MTYNSFTNGSRVAKLGKRNAQICDVILVMSFRIVMSCNHLNSSLFEIVNKMSITRR